MCFMYVGIPKCKIIISLHAYTYLTVFFFSFHLVNFLKNIVQLFHVFIAINPIKHNLIFYNAQTQHHYKTKLPVLSSFLFFQNLIKHKINLIVPLLICNFN